MISPHPYSCAVRRTRMKQAICFLFRPREQRDDRRSLKSGTRHIASWRQTHDDYLAIRAQRRQTKVRRTAPVGLFSRGPSCNLHERDRDCAEALGR